MSADLVQVRRARDAERSLLLGIFNAARAAAGCFTVKAVDWEAFARLIEGEEILLAERGGQVVGFVSVWLADRFIHHLYIAPHVQGQGVGSALLQACEETYGRPLSLKCDVGNLRAQHFYKRKGWFPTETGVGDDGPWQRLQSPPG